MSDLENNLKQIESHVDAWREKESKRVDELSAMVTDLAQKRSDTPANFGNLRKASQKLGAAVKSAEIQRLLNGEVKTARAIIDNPMMFKAITGDVGTPAAPGDVFSQPTRMSGIAANGVRRLRVAEVLRTLPADSNQVSATVEGASVSGVAGQAFEGDLKGETDFAFDLKTVPVITLAHTVPVSNQVLQDSDALEQFLNQRMTEFVYRKHEEQIISGDGTAGNFSGLTLAGNHTVYTAEAGDTGLDSIRKAVAEMEDLDFDATAIMLHPKDWAQIELTKDQQDAYVLGNGGSASYVSQGMGANLWGVPVITSKAIARGKFIAADTENAIAHFLRSDVVVELGYVDDQFNRNFSTLRAEMRGALIVTNANGVQYGDLVASAT